ncbi:hypothetical protein MOMUL_27680 [Moorella mulderi DSM 14980]|uniref:Uncharacterized protein n=1 Tax=Moorella mulderi DSM 14980 TaxID=1122241 RepID=A0A151ATJ1_9FIRM|nr:hypothetical protein MOMUL_27680 [Moorella mulderi DSM 14980]
MFSSLTPVHTWVSSWGLIRILSIFGTRVSLILRTPQVECLAKVCTSSTFSASPREVI